MVRYIFSSRALKLVSGVKECSCECSFKIWSWLSEYLKSCWLFSNSSCILWYSEWPSSSTRVLGRCVWRGGGTHKFKTLVLITNWVTHQPWCVTLPRSLKLLRQSFEFCDFCLFSTFSFIRFYVLHRIELNLVLAENMEKTGCNLNRRFFRFALDPEI